MTEELRGQMEACGIDVEGALARMMGNENLFFRMMKKFTEDTIFPSLKESLKAQDYKKGFEYAHALKGVAGNLGLDSIMKADEIIVEKLRHYTEGSVPGIEEDLKNLEENYNKVMEVLKQF